MTRSRWDARTDGNHALIRDTLRALGWLVYDCHHEPKWVDLIAYRSTHGVVPIEVKGEGGKLRPSQQQLIDDGWPIVVLRTVADCEALTEA